MVALATLLLVAALGARGWRDPLRLQTSTTWRGEASAAAAWLPVAVAAVSLAQSPVARAGYALLALLPLVLLAPAAVAQAWRDTPRRRAGLCGVAVALVLVAGEALARQALEGHPRAALPLGHHNLLALWLLLVLPLPVGLLVDGSRSGWGQAPRLRKSEPGTVGASSAGEPADAAARVGARGAAAIVLAWLALLLGVAALVATGSLAGAIGLLVEVAVGAALLAAKASQRMRRVAVALVPVLLLVLAVWQGPRLVDVATGGDPSLRARAAYWTAGLRGFAERPVLGWGPGASSWLLHQHLRPVPGVHPAYEVVTDLHSLPLEVLYEGGAAGSFAVVLALVLFARARRRDLDAGAAAVPRLGALLGLAGAGAAACVTGLFDLPALALAAAVTAGAALPPSRNVPDSRATSPRSWAPWAVLVGVVVLLGPDLRGHWHYQRALRHLGEGDVQVAGDELVAAALTDSRQPLYALRQALPPLPGADPTRALAAAELARGLAPLWLRAGAVAGTPSTSWRRQALERACDLEPFGALAPFLLAREELRAAELARRVGPGTGRWQWPGASDPGGLRRGVRVGQVVQLEERVALLLARALAAEPRLATAAELEPQHLARALRVLERVEAWPIGWRAAAVERLGALATRSEAEASRVPPADETLADLALTIDALGSTSLSLFAFRREPTPATLVSVPLRAAAAGALELPPLWSLRDVPSPRWSRGCGWLEP